MLYAQCMLIIRRQHTIGIPCTAVILWTDRVGIGLKNADPFLLQNVLLSFVMLISRLQDSCEERPTIEMAELAIQASICVS
jgi:hypothetical protein